MKILNLILIVIIGFFVSIVAAFFYIGSEESYNELIKNLWKAFSLRFIGFVLLGLIFLLPIIFLNIIIIRFSSSRTKIKKLVTEGLIFILLGSLIGTTIFFF